MNSLFPVLVETPSGESFVDLEFTPVRKHYVGYAGGASLSHELSTRVTMAANYGYRLTDGLHDSRFLTHGASASLRYGLTRNLGLRLGYGYSEGRYADSDEHYANHNLDVGLGYDRALSLSRRTTLSFQTGSSAYVNKNRTHFRASGGARLNHQLGRTWTASIAYDRGVRFVEALRQPVFSDGVTASLGGLISRRLEFEANARAALGTVGDGQQNGFNSYRGAASLSMGLTRYLGVGISYSYYRNDFESSALLPSGFPHALERHSVSAGINLWAPLFYQRSTNAAR
jgi:hypothetical protein